MIDKIKKGQPEPDTPDGEGARDAREAQTLLDDLTVLTARNTHAAEMGPAQQQVAIELEPNGDDPFLGMIHTGSHRTLRDILEGLPSPSTTAIEAG